MKGPFPLGICGNPEWMRRPRLGIHHLTSANGQEADEGVMIGWYWKPWWYSLQQENAASWGSMIGHEEFGGCYIVGRDIFEGTSKVRGNLLKWLRGLIPVTNRLGLCPSFAI